MKMIKEEVKLVTGEVKEISLSYLGLRLVQQLKSKYMKVNKITPTGTGVESMEGVFDFSGLQLEVLEKCVKGISLDELDPEEGERIYITYYEKYFNAKNKSEEN